VGAGDPDPYYVQTSEAVKAGILTVISPGRKGLAFHHSSEAMRGKVLFLHKRPEGMPRSGTGQVIGSSWGKSSSKIDLSKPRVSSNLTVEDNHCGRRDAGPIVKKAVESPRAKNYGWWANYFKVKITCPVIV